MIHADRAPRQETTADRNMGMDLLAPPLPDMPTPVTLPSHGAALHGTGNCKPCAWFWKPQGCSNGQECLHCHMCPEGEIKARKQAKMNIARSSVFMSQASSIGMPQVSPVLMPPPGLAASQMDDFCSCEPLATQAQDELAIQLGDDRSTAAASSDEEKLLHDREPLSGLSLHPVHLLPSRGSALQGSGMCRPCGWFWKPQGCSNGWECCHCHSFPPDEIKERKQQKAAAMRMGALQH